MMTNVMVKTCLNQKIIKNSILIQAMKNSVCPKAKVIRKPNFFESRICPNISPNNYRMFRSVDWGCGLKTRHDNRELRWSNTYSIFPKAEFVRIFTDCSVAWIEHTTWWSWSGTYSFDTSANFALWQMRHRFNPHKRVNDYQRSSMLTVLPLMSMSCTLGNSCSL